MLVSVCSVIRNFYCNARHIFCKYSVSYDVVILSYLHVMLVVTVIHHQTLYHVIDLLFWFFIPTGSSSWEH